MNDLYESQTKTELNSAWDSHTTEHYTAPKKMGIQKMMHIETYLLLITAESWQITA